MLTPRAMEPDSCIASASQTAVDQRENERYPVGMAARVIVLDESRRTIPATIENISNRGAQLTITQGIPCYSLVKIEYEDNYLLGEIVYCQPCDPGWVVGVRIEHGMFGLTALASALKER